MKKILNCQRPLWRILGGIFDAQNAEKKILDLNSEISKDNFWKDRERSKKIIREKNFIESILNFYTDSQKNLINIKDLNKLAFEENDSETLNDCLEKVLGILSELKKFEIKCFLSGENDHLNIYIPSITYITQISSNMKLFQCFLQHWNIKLLITGEVWQFYIQWIIHSLW